MTAHSDRREFLKSTGLLPIGRTLGERPDATTGNKPSSPVRHGAKIKLSLNAWSCHVQLNRHIAERPDAGGMGEVYLARDTKLGRDGALKVLPEAVEQDGGSISRFGREARSLAALNHPHIAMLRHQGPTCPPRSGRSAQHTSRCVSLAAMV